VRISINPRFNEPREAEESSVKTRVNRFGRPCAFYFYLSNFIQTDCYCTSVRCAGKFDNVEEIERYLFALYISRDRRRDFRRALGVIDRIEKRECNRARRYFLLIPLPVGQRALVYNLRGHLTASMAIIAATGRDNAI